MCAHHVGFPGFAALGSIAPSLCLDCTVLVRILQPAFLVVRVFDILDLDPPILADCTSSP